MGRGWGGEDPIIHTCPFLLISLPPLLRSLRPGSAPTATFTFSLHLNNNIHVLFAKEVDRSPSDVF